MSNEADTCLEEFHVGDGTHNSPLGSTANGAGDTDMTGPSEHPKCQESESIDENRYPQSFQYQCYRTSGIAIHRDQHKRKGNDFLASGNK